MTRDERFEWVRRQGGDRYFAWLAAGYKESFQGQPLGRMTNYLLQKRIRDARGTTLFFINTWVYDWTNCSNWSSERIAYEAEANFNSHGDQPPTFNVVLHRPETPEATEAFFRKMYDAMGCQPYGDD